MFQQPIKRTSFLIILLLFNYLHSIDTKYKKDNIGFCIYSITQDSTILSHNADKEFIYASGVKLITSLVALEKLGSYHKFETKFKIIRDTLFIKAGGDPSTVLEDFFFLLSILDKTSETSTETVPTRIGFPK